MKLLLDTHVFLWHVSDDPRLPAPFLAAYPVPTLSVD
jgi:PIN domain nuclease of toxin-antitoxin system